MLPNLVKVKQHIWKTEDNNFKNKYELSWQLNYLKLSILNFCMWVSSVTFEVPLRPMHCDGLGVSSQLIRNKLQVSREKKDYGEKW